MSKVKYLYDYIEHTQEEALNILLQNIEENNHDTYIINNLREHDCFGSEGKDFTPFKNIQTKLEEYNSNLIILQSGYIDTLQLERMFPRIKFIKYSFTYIRYILNELGVDFINNIKIPNEFWRFGLYLNHKPHPWRCELVDSVALLWSDFFSMSTFTWHYIYEEHWGQPYEWKFWKEEVKNINQHEPLIGNKCYELDLSEKHAVQLISESSIDYFFLSDKTVKPLLFKQLFLVHGCIGFHTYLKNHFGFKLYDELFDYSFDMNPNTEYRARQVVKQLKNLHEKYPAEKDWKKMYVSVKDKLNYNQQRCYELLNDKKLNKEWFDFLSEYKNHLPKEVLDFYNGNILPTKKQSLI